MAKEAVRDCFHGAVTRSTPVLGTKRLVVAWVAMAMVIRVMWWFFGEVAWLGFGYGGGMINRDLEGLVLFGRGVWDFILGGVDMMWIR